MRRPFVLLALCALVVFGVAAAIPGFNAGHYLTLGYLHSVLNGLRDLAIASPIAAAAAFVMLYICITAVSIPGAALVLTPSAGAIFGLLEGTVLCSVASTIGATLAFQLSRLLFRGFVERRFAVATDLVNRGIEKDGGYYLFAMRLTPIFPFFVINLVMGVTRLPARTFYWVSQVGMLPGTAVFVNAGVQIGRIDSPGDVLSPALLSSLVLLGVFPLIARKAATFLAQKHRLAPYPRPKTFDANLVVIGAGAAGLVSAYVAAAARAKVVLIEEERMGGDCLYRGCVPSKSLIRSARIAALLRRAGEFGVPAPDGTGMRADLARVMGRVQHVIGQIEPHDSVERYSALGVDCVRGHARITSPWTVEVDGRAITTRSIIIATGGRPAVPGIPGLTDVPHVTSDTLWNVTELPRRLLVLGGGPIGCEMAQAFRQLGSEVVVIELLPRLLAREDADASAAVASRFVAEGIRVLAGWKALAFQRRGEGGVLHCENGEDKTEVGFDLALIATGRLANTTGLGLEELGLQLNGDGTVEVDEFLRTDLPNILACGDVAGPFQLTHAAAYQAWYCAMNALFGHFWTFRPDYSVVPRAVFTDPEVAQVGVTASEASERELPVETTIYDIGELDRAIADGENRGFVKVLTPPGRDRILGVTVVGPHAGDIIAEFVLAMRHGLGLRKVLGTIHIYPTLTEANRFAAGEWQRRHVPGWLLGLAGAVNRRRRRAGPEEKEQAENNRPTR